jgi:uncharacterized DUF497 family protein
MRNNQLSQHGHRCRVVSTCIASGVTLSHVIFSWDEWNTGHIAVHGVTRAEAEYVVRNAANPFPRQTGDGKHLVWGQTNEGRYLQVIFVYRESDELEFESLTLDQWITISAGPVSEIVYVVHSMTLPPKLVKQYRRLRR